MGDDHIRFNTDSGELFLLDQRHLPLLTEWFVCRTVDEVVTALQVMVVRGAPAIGVTAAYGCCIAARQVAGQEDWRPALEALLETLAAARPTAVNLKWAVDRVRRAWSELPSRLSAGGHLVYVQPTTTNLERHPRPSRRFLFAPGELEAKVRAAGLRVVRSEEGWDALGHHTARLLAAR